MGMGPIFGNVMGQMQEEQQRLWQQELANAATQPIPGFTGPAGPSTSTQSRWGSLNGRLVGDQYLPPDVSTVDVGNGWYDVNHGGQRVGTLRPGGRNGQFINNTNWQMPQPGLPASPPVPAAPAAPPANMAQTDMAYPGVTPDKPYGAQALQLSGLLGNPPAQAQPSRGLLGGRGGFRIPGGK